MAKKTRKTKRSSNLVRDKELVALAKTAKRHGLISKQAKLHGGKAISRKTAKHVRELEWRIRAGHVAQPVSKKTLEAYKRAGVATAGGKVIRPPGRKAAEAIRHGEIIEVRPNLGNGEQYISRTKAVGGREIHELLKNPPPLKPGEYYSYKYGNARKYYTNAESMQKDLEKYVDVWSEKDEDFAIEIETVDRSQVIEYMEERGSRKRPKKERTHFGRIPDSIDMYERDAMRKAAQRASMSADARAAYLEAERERKKRARRNRNK